MKNKLCSVIFAVAVFFFIISFSIALPIYFRPFYYVQINTLELEDESGYTYAEIREAYDEVLDYLTIPGREFGTGVMRYSESGAAHFEDCKILFMLDGVILLISAVIMSVFLILKKCKRLEAFKLGRFSASFGAAVSVLGIFAFIALLASSNFDNFFKLFHKIFFSGKDNWYFDPRYDEIINVLPQKFFMNCAILIVCSIFAFSIALIVKEIISLKLSKRKNG